MRERSQNCIHQIVREHAGRNPDAVALAAPGRSPLSYGGLLAQIDGLGDQLWSLGLMPGDRVAIVMPDGPEMAVAFLAVSAVATAAPLNPRSTRHEFASSFADLKVQTLLTSESVEAPAVVAAREAGIRVISIVPQTAAGAFSLKGITSVQHGDVSPPDSGAVALLLKTSGTTSRPKIVPLTHANLYRSAINTAASLGLQPSDCCLDIMPLFHVHGLIGGVLSSLAAGASVICPPGFDAPRFFDWVDELKPTWYTAVPTMHRAILARAGARSEVIARRRLRFTRSSSAALPEAVRASLEATFGVPVIEAYGMTEASHQIAVNPQPPGVRKPGSVGVPTGAFVTVIDRNGQRLGARQTGEIAIRGASVITTYEAAGEDAESAFVDGWLRTGDEGYVDDDGYLFITGRLKETINRGGEKINPREVDEILEQHPAVAQAATFGVPDAGLGQDVAAAVVLRPGARCSGRELREFVEIRLASFKVPARVLLLDRIPTGATGKVERRRLAEELGDQLSRPASAAGAAEFVPPVTDVEKTLARIWCEVLAVDRVGMNDSFFDLGGDSVLAARALARMHAELGADLSFVTLFDCPTLGDSARLISPRVDATSTGLPEAGTGPQTSPEADIEAPLSFGQQRLWFVEQLQPDSGAFNSRIPIRFRGHLDVEALTHSFAALAARHAALRASFPSHDGQPVQRIAAQLHVPFTTVDRSNVPEPQRDEQIEHLVSAQLNQPFDLSRGPLIRVSLVRFAADDHLLLITLHHMIYDGWSRTVMLRDLSAFYTSFVRGVPDSLPPLPLQYTDYAMSEVRDGEVLQEQLDFWKQQLSGTLPVVELPADRPEPPGIDMTGAFEELRLSTRLTDAIDELSRRLSVTPFMTFLAAYALLLSRLTSIDDIIIAAPLAGRTEVELEGLIGFFIKNLILRTDLSGNPRFDELVTRVRTVTLNAFDHQDVPFQKLVDALRVERFANRNPLFEIVINFQNAPDPVLDFDAVHAELVHWPDKRAQNTLTLYVWKEEQRYTVRTLFQVARLSPERMAHFMSQLQFLLEQAAAAPDRPIHMYSLVPPSAAGLLPDPTLALPEPEHRPVGALVFARASATPTAVAVVQSGHSWTYEELAASAGHLLDALSTLGHKPGDVVAVLGPPTFGVIASMVGVMASRNVLLTLDPDLPLERKRLMLSEARASRVLVVMREGSDDDPLAFATCPVSRVDPDTGQMIVHAAELPLAPRRHDVAPAAEQARPDDPAYVFFTSGSSGVPRAVLGRHKSLTHFIDWQRAQFSVTPQDRCAQLTSLTFDVVLRDVFLPLTSGAVLCLPESRRQTGADVIAWLDREHVTLLHSVPSLAASWLDQRAEGSLRTLRHLFLSGEPLTDRLVRRWRDAFPEAGAIVNLYGATEATLAQCFSVVPDTPAPGVQPVGVPLPDTQALVLGGERRLCGVGERGEVALRSPFLTLGYLNSPDETRTRFLRNPFREDESDLIYLTGDEGRYRPDGTLDVLGRLDNQVKIRGVRVEPQEIDLHLLQHPSVRASCVVARKGADGETSLVAYVVPSTADTPSANQLRTFLSRRLPSAMVPSAFVVLPELPLLPNGKIDRQALAGPPPAVVSPQAREVPRESVRLSLDDAERYRLLVEWNDTATDYPSGTCLHELVEAQAARTPRATAVVFEGDAISYATLNARANQLAHLLRARGVSRDGFVAVCLERSIDMVVALLGILKAGGAYVPLDPTYPIERLQFMLNEAAAPVLVTTSDLSSRLRMDSARPLYLDTESALLSAESSANLQIVSTPDSLAYVIFTSGSTGNPKGVMVPHRAIVNHMRWMQGAFPLTADDRVLQRTPYSFDASVWEFWAPLVAGAVLVMAPSVPRFQPTAVLEMIEANRITVLQLVPSLLGLLLDVPDLSSCASLRRVFCGGERLPVDLQDRFFSRLDASLHNLYGPTECCIDSVFWTCRRGSADRIVPIGRPVANTQVYVLDEQLQPVPVGAEGELYIGGQCVARGYLGQPALTAERFIRHPFSEDPQARLYRTGDRVRYRPDGNLEFLGRLDDQVKLNGLRIEPGEIEAALRRHPSVVATVVVLREDPPGDRRLVAYLATMQSPAPGNDEIRGFLRDWLPEPFLPSQYVWLDALPLGPNGKVDRQRLPRPPHQRPELASEYVAPRTPVEETLARIWSEVLGVEPIGVDDDFFDLGGHSLRATQVIARVNKAFRRTVPLRRLFEQPTIAELAKALE